MSADKSASQQFRNKITKIDMNVLPFGSRFQTPYFWPSNCWDPENTDYAVYLCKRTMQNKTRLELADYEAENLARLQKMFSRKWEFIFMQVKNYIDFI